MTREEAVSIIEDRVRVTEYIKSSYVDCVDIEALRIAIKALAQQEPLTDKEQRIFLAAIAREERICEEVDRNYVSEPYEDSLVSVCKKIKRKVKSVLWANS